MTRVRSLATVRLMSQSLFDHSSRAPLAERLRPQSLTAIVGQDALLGPKGALGRMLAAGQLSSLVLWGPPGCGKTSIARLLADAVGLSFEPLSAVFSGVADLKKVFERARLRREQGLGTLLFVDEVHRFNRAQQDSFLPVVEDGTLILVGATTENPSFELNAALLSRCLVVVLERLDEAALAALLARAEGELAQPLPLDTEARAELLKLADGDGRYLLTLVEQIMQHLPDGQLDVAGLSELLNKRPPLYDKSQDAHYNLISALHKSLRGSDVDAGLYWLARMLAGGEDPGYILRRLVRFASEDIGLADPQALVQALACWDAFDRLGQPEGELALAQAVIYLGTAPKSNAGYRGWKAAQRAAADSGSLSPPAHILNAPTGLMKELGYAQGYAYDHDAQDGFSGQNYFPESMPRADFYQPVERGFEREIAKRLAYWARLRQARQAEPSPAAKAQANGQPAPNSQPRNASQQRKASA